MSRIFGAATHVVPRRQYSRLVSRTERKTGTSSSAEHCRLVRIADKFVQEITFSRHVKAKRRLCSMSSSAILVQGRAKEFSPCLKIPAPVLPVNLASPCTAISQFRKVRAKFTELSTISFAQPCTLARCGAGILRRNKHEFEVCKWAVRSLSASAW